MAENLRQQRGEATRATILAVARRLFSDFGYHNTGIADIQAATGLTKGAFYHHFRAKQDLALAVLELAREDYDRQVFAPALAESTAGRRLTALLDRLVEINARPEWLNCRLLVSLSAEVSAADGPLTEEVQRLQREILERFTALIDGAQDSGEACPGPARAWAQLLFAALLGLVLIRKTAAVEPDFAGAVDLVKHRLLMDSPPQGKPDAHLPRLVRFATDSDCF